ncbi:MAG: pentapeptide repeat-containing protein [Clostridiaceae bacterium]|jgi:uncharacterized protein YjbI with pentapeptide repeats|nr:pentapeptide repeat-containing protein [Clostridiaceae bacterium]
MIRKHTMLMVIIGLLVMSYIKVYATDSDFSQEDFNKVLSGDKNLYELRIEGANLSGKDLSGANFTNTDLEGADLSGANLTGANFTHADLEEVNLKGANLTNAIFYHADLEEADMKGANITGANFKQAELEYAIWSDGRVCAEGSIGGCW